MSRSRIALAMLPFVVITVAGAALLGRRVTGDSSVLSLGAGGWLGARRYLEARGREVRLLREADPARPAGGVLVVAFPWQRTDSGEARRAAERHLDRGGRLLLGFDGGPFAFDETRFLEALGLSWRDVAGRPPLDPLSWRRFVTREWALQPQGGSGAGRGVARMKAPRRVPRAPGDAHVLYVGDGDVPVVYSYPWRAGRVIVLPSEVLSNGRLSETGNADLLEALCRILAGAWTIDEYHHGLTAPLGTTGERLERTFDLYLLHLGFLYALTVLTLAQRFGPAWSEPPVIAGTTGSFLAGLGSLHHRLRHHAAAARLLVTRVQELDPQQRIPETLVRAASDADAQGFVALAKEVARLQAGGGKKE